MQWRELRCFWIDPGDSNGPIGFGVTAFSLDDALLLIELLGFRLQTDPQMISVTENVRFEMLDDHVQRNMGPMVVRGLWYPFSILGVPDW